MTNEVDVPSLSGQAERTEEALRRSEQMLSEAQRVAHVGCWEFDHERGAVWSDERYRILGLAPQSRPAGLELLLQCVHPEDRRLVEENALETRRTGAPFDIHYRAVRPDGTIRWIHALGGLVRESPEMWFGTDQDVTELRAAVDALRRSEERYRSLFERNMAGVYRSTMEGRLLDCNDTFARIYGFSTAEEMLGVSMVDLYGQPSDRTAYVERLRREGRLMTSETEGRRRDGTPVWVLENVALVQTPEGEPVLEGTLLDVTEMKALESQLAQAQKMEAVGRLAGGVAHDFNNFLTVVSGCSELLLQSPRLDPSLQRLAGTIHKASAKAAAVTRQLLAFSRKQTTVLRVLDVSEVVAGVEGLLSRMIGEDVQIALVRGRRLWTVKADKSLLEQAVINLAVNARDAMPGGGTLTLETANVELDDAFVRLHAGARPGAWVRLSVTDTGVGMGPDVLSHLFEPFFTTKEPGKGTGLGLAMVYGVVKQAGGFITVESAPGRGSTFRVHLPRHDTAAITADAPAVAEEVPRGTETLLLVEDDDLLRGVARSMLEAAGYTVYEARDGLAALSVAAAAQTEIQLLVTDVVMPGMNGPALARRLSSERPGMKVLFMSGYTDDERVRRGVAENRMPFLQKPFSSAVFVRKVRQILDAPAAPVERAPSV